MVTSVWMWAAWEPPLHSNYRVAVRRQAVDALDGTTRPWEASFEILAVAFYKGHQIDCAWAQAHSSLILFRKALVCDSRLKETLKDDKPMPGTMLAALDHLLSVLGLTRQNDVIRSPLCAMSLKIDTLEPTQMFAHNFREVVRAHHLAALEKRRPAEFAGCGFTPEPTYVESANRGMKARATTLLCSICGAMDTVSHIVAECPGVPGGHRDYLDKITTGLPQATPEITELGEKEYAKFAHLLAASLVKRNMLNAELEEKTLPVKRILRGEQPPPRAFVLDRAILAKRVKVAKRGPNLNQRLQMEYNLDDEGFWRTSVWHLKFVYVQSACDGRRRTVHKDHLGSAPKRIEFSKGSVRCKVCGAIRSTKHTAHFIKKHGKLRASILRFAPSDLACIILEVLPLKLLCPSLGGDRYAWLPRECLHVRLLRLRLVFNDS
eukprot:5641843-Amphidinium_carterae.1